MMVGLCNVILQLSGSSGH